MRRVAPFGAGEVSVTRPTDATPGAAGGTGFALRTVRIVLDERSPVHARLRRLADAVAGALLAEPVCLAWYDRALRQESPAHASDCHGDCELPGYEEYALTRGAELKVVVNDGAAVFLYRPLGEFA